MRTCYREFSSLTRAAKYPTDDGTVQYGSQTDNVRAHLKQIFQDVKTCTCKLLYLSSKAKKKKKPYFLMFL